MIINHYVSGIFILTLSLLFRIVSYNFLYLFHPILCQVTRIDHHQGKGIRLHDGT